MSKPALLLLAMACFTSGCDEHTNSASLHFPAAQPGIVEDRFALLALSCVQRDYPNKIAHFLNSAADVRPPRELTPVFYGCYDWHSAVHGHWLLARILKLDPDSPMRKSIDSVLSQSLTDDKIAGEIAYFLRPGAKSFERPYGIAWFLQLVAELHESDDPMFQDWWTTLVPLEKVVVDRTKAWLPHLYYPIRLGTHNQTAFAFGLMLDYARTIGDDELERMVSEKALSFHLGDKNCPLEYEPSGEDFLSPCLMEADLMRRILTQREFADWLSDFMPGIPTSGDGDWLMPGVVLDANDGKLGHLDGVNLSRAWALEGIAAALPASNFRRPALSAAADLHREKGIAAVSDENYLGSHWLGSFATYLTTKRGLTGPGMRFSSQ